MGIVDIHTHLGDVCCGAYRHPPSAPSGSAERVTPSLLERSDYNPFLTWLAQSSLLPRSFVENAAKHAASLARGECLADEMSRAKVELSVVLPVEPFSPTHAVLEQCRFFPGKMTPLLSVDFRGLTQADIRAAVEAKLAEFPFKGIKFHPNLQGISVDSLAAQALFEVAAARNLFILTHGGSSPLGRTRSLAKPDQLVAIAKSHPKTTFIVAHGGNYFGNPRPFLRQVASMENVRVDTSAVRSADIAFALDVMSPKRVLFGSDWPYSTQGHALKCLEAGVRLYTRDNNESVFRTVTQDNARELLK